MNLLFVLLILLLANRLCSEVAERLKQPALFGELIAGIGLGLVLQSYSASLPVLAALPENEVFKGLTSFSIFFLMLLAGIELRPRDLVQVSGPAIGVAVGGMLLPLLSGFTLGWFYMPASEYKIAQSLFLATALAITAISVSVRYYWILGYSYHE